MKMQAPIASRPIEVIGTGGHTYVLVPDNDFRCDVPDNCVLEAQHKGWKPIGNPVYDSEKKAGFAGAAEKLVEKFKEITAPPEPVDCFLCDEEIKTGEPTALLVERDGEVYLCKPDEKGELAHDACYLKMQDSPGTSEE